MKVCFDISAGLSQTGGIGRYERELARALAGLPAGPQISLFSNRQPLDRLPAELGHLPRVSVPLGDKAWRAWAWLGLPLPGRWLNTSSFDLFHGADVVIPAIARPAVITIHDLSTLLFPQHHTRLHRWFDRLSLPRMVQRATAIIADSDSTKRDIVRRLGVPEGKVHTVHLGVDSARFYPRDPAEARRRAGDYLRLAPPYLVAVGTLEPRKNLPALLRAFAGLPEPRPRLVLAGAQGWGAGSIGDLARRMNLHESVMLAGYVPDDMLPWLYAGALGFVYPSVYEGFGLPVLEAMACGAPVITSTASSLPEVAGDACLLVDPRDELALAQAIERLAGDSRLGDDLRARGLARAATFSWERTARRTMEVYRLAVHQEAPK